MSKPMELVKHLLGDKTELKCQVVLDGGMAAPGTLKLGAVEGTLHLRSPVGHPQTGKQIGEVDTYFFPEAIICIQLPVESPVVQMPTDGRFSIPRIGG